MSAIFSYEPRTEQFVGSAAGQHFSLLTQHAPTADSSGTRGRRTVTNWGKDGEVRPGKWTPSDFSFEMPGHHRPALRSLHLSVLTEADRLNVAARGMHALNDCLRARQGAIVLAEEQRGRVSRPRLATLSKRALLSHPSPLHRVPPSSRPRERKSPGPSAQVTRRRCAPSVQIGILLLLHCATSAR